MTNIRNNHPAIVYGFVMQGKARRMGHNRSDMATPTSRIRRSVLSATSHGSFSQALR
jgi:hypothetical protein